MMEPGPLTVRSQSCWPEDCDLTVTPAGSATVNSPEPQMPRRLWTSPRARGMVSALLVFKLRRAHALTVPNSLGCLCFLDRKRSHSSTSSSVSSSATDFNSKSGLLRQKTHIHHDSVSARPCACCGKSPKDGRVTGGRPEVCGSLGHSKGF